MSDKIHLRDLNGICWTTRTVKGDMAWTLCGRSSYEVVLRCDEHSSLKGAYYCTNCDNVEAKEREVICWKCGKGEMVYRRK